MAVSGMDYTKMLNLISHLETQKASITALISDLASTAPAQIAEAYSGEAAETYKSTLATVTTNIDETLSKMITDLKTNAEQKQVEYSQQDKKMQDSIAAPTMQQ